MRRHHITALAIASLIGVCLPGCGSSSGPIAQAPPPTATAVGAGTTPTAGVASSASSKKHTRSAMATGKHDHLGEACSGRDQALYAREGMFCVTGRLEKKHR